MKSSRLWSVTSAAATEVAAVMTVRREVMIRIVVPMHRHRNDLTHLAEVEQQEEDADELSRTMEGNASASPSQASNESDASTHIELYLAEAKRQERKTWTSPST